MGATQSLVKPYVLQTDKGRLQGLEYTSTKSGKRVCYRYCKIPYAQPPLGDLRWCRPQPLPANQSFDDAASGNPGDYTHFGPICPQPIYGHVAAALANPSAAPPIVNVEDEDCLYLNIWVPAGEAPKGGWPVQFQIHGGWLQVGNSSQSNDHDPFDLLLHSRPRIIVAPTYRLNVLGFLAGADIATGNFGLWDQRAALEWTHTNISLFSGNPNNITVGGLSAGSYSAFLQLYYDTYLPDSQRIIKRAYLWSNAIAIQPNSATSPFVTEQFNSLCSVNGISTSLPASEKLSLLRQIPASSLISSLSKLKYHTFRAVTDRSFIPTTFLSSIHDGSFTTLLAEHNVSIILGEVSNEANLYALVNPPTDYSDLLVQLQNYYPDSVVKAILKTHPIPEKSCTDSKAWIDVFSQMVADGQVHASVRGLTHQLLHPPKGPGIKPLPVSSVHRYRIEWRAKSLDEWIQPTLGVCHAADIPIWWVSGFRAGYTPEDEEAALKFIEPFGDFLYGETVNWGGTGRADEVRLLTKEGSVVKGWRDPDWERGLEVWNVLWEAQRGS
jgi:carboxylesterase type B